MVSVLPYIDINGLRSLFVHIPKCGGTTVERYLEQYAPLHLFNPNASSAFRYTPQHFTYEDAAGLFPEGYFSYAFAICRNPYTKIESEYRFQCISKFHRYTDYIEPFPEWISRLFDRLCSDPFFPDNHLRLQRDFVSEKMKIFRLEDGMDSIIEEISSTAGLPLPNAKMERQNDTSSYGIETPWTDLERETVYKIYKQDFDWFGYEA